VLDALLVLAVIGGVSVPLGHQALKWFVRRRPQGAATDGSARPPEQPGSPSGGDSNGDGTPR